MGSRGGSPPTTTSSRPLRSTQTLSSVAGASKITDYETAFAYLRKNTLVPEEQPSIPSLASGLLHLADSLASKDRTTFECLRAFSFYTQRVMIEDMAQAAATLIAKKTREEMDGTLRVLIGRADDIDTAMTRLGDFEKMDREVGLTLKECCEDLKAEVKDLKEAHKTTLTETTERMQTIQERVELTIAEHQDTLPRPPPSFAEVVSKLNPANPPPHAATLARHEQRARKVLIDAEQFQDTGRDPSFNEKELLQRAGLAIGMMREDIVEAAKELDAGGEENVPAELMARAQLDIPKGLTFISVRRLRNGGIEYELESAYSAQWLAEASTQKLFTSKMGLTAATVKQPAYRLVLLNVPIHFIPDSQIQLEIIEAQNSLDRGTIMQATWIKKPERRSLNQLTAH
ncbi:hypothetical protein K474DRAFT_1650995, partial [Panus rudis PR-1116 ss-1]